jgi:hypothetical protein
MVATYILGAQENLQGIHIYEVKGSFKTTIYIFYSCRKIRWRALLQKVTMPTTALRTRQW